jgi:hypothetical protein
MMFLIFVLVISPLSAVYQLNSKVIALPLSHPRLSQPHVLFLL